MTRKAYITINTPFVVTNTFISTDKVKQTTSLCPILNHCSLSDIRVEERNFIFGYVEVQSLEFVGDIADHNHGKNDPAFGKQIQKQYVIYNEGGVSSFLLKNVSFYLILTTSTALIKFPSLMKK